MDTARAPEGTAGNFPEIVELSLDSPEVFVNRELSWLAFARRALALVEDPALPLLEQIKFAGIMGMLHDEFFMKRVSGLKRQIATGSKRRSPDGLLPQDELAACREEIVRQSGILHESEDAARERQPAQLAVEEDLGRIQSDLDGVRVHDRAVRRSRGFHGDLVPCSDRS